jgi:hypothetical protein
MTLNTRNPFKSMRLPALLVIALSFIVQGVSATYWVNQTNLITGTNPLGLMIPLGIEHFVPVLDAIMYYNYISIFLVRQMKAGSRSSYPCLPG